MTDKTVTVDAGTTEEKSKGKNLASRVPEVQEIDGYITSRRACELLGNIPMTTINNYAYAGKIDAVRISGIFLFKRASVEAYKPVLDAQKDAQGKRVQEKARKANKRELMAQLEKLVEESLSKGDLPDMQALKASLGM